MSRKEEKKREETEAKAEETKSVKGEERAEAAEAAPAGGKGEEEKAKSGDVLKQLEEAREKIATLQRFAAEMDNCRKRALAETEHEVERTKESILRELLPTLDDFELAVRSAENDTTKNFDQMLEGVEMVQKNMYRRLADNYGLVKMEPEGQPFDPVSHEAVMMERDGKYTFEVVVQSLVTGYRLGAKVLRAAKVKVGKPEN